MPDMLVKLYELPDPLLVIQEQAAAGITIRRALPPEKDSVTAWIGQAFGDYWTSESEVAFSHQPVGCYIALRESEILGFGCYDVTAKGLFGPTGVAESARGLGIGKALLLVCLYNMWMDGYAYAVIGGVGPAEFYTKAVGAVLIADSDPGIYKGMLK